MSDSRNLSAATIFDVAELAGVSIKTVSRVVNNEPNVREKTRDKVMAAVTKLGYRPNSAARGLSGKRSYVIGLIYENPHEFSYIGDVLNGAIEASEELGYSTLLRPLNLPDPDIEDTVRRFVTQTNADGIVLPPPICDMPNVLQVLRELETPVASITPSTAANATVSVHCEDENAIHKLTEFLIEQGHRRIGFIKGHPDHFSSDLRLKGYKSALKAGGISFDRQLVKQGYFDFESGQKAATKLLDLDPRPTAIIASNDDMAAGVYFEARHLGLDVPHDLSLVGFDDTPLAARIWPPLTTVRQPIREMSSLVTRLLIQSLRGDSTVAEPESFDCEIMIRQSTRDIHS